MGYQTILLPDGAITNGCFPTLEWFKTIQGLVDFTGKIVADFGCNEFMLGICSANAGAKHVYGIDNQEEIFKTAEALVNKWGLQNKVTLILGDIENFATEVDIGLLSMILHWAKDGPWFLTNVASRTRNTLIIIHRLPHPDYQTPINGAWFPTIEELISLLPDFILIHTSLLLIQDNNKKIMLSIFRRC